jgi:dTDP-4-amino-4,6-dideoxygalactose transaminase
VASRLLTLPLFGHMTDEQLDYVTDRIIAALEDPVIATAER